MSNVNYTNAPADVRGSFDSPVFVNDLLPPPGKLLRKTEKEKITLAIDKQSLELYKNYAKEHNTKYQPMMDSVLSAYAWRYLSGDHINAYRITIFMSSPYSPSDHKFNWSHNKSDNSIESMNSSPNTSSVKSQSILEGVR